MTRNDVKLGVVGLGNIGHYHADRLAELGANLVGGMDIDSDARGRFEDKFDVPTFEDHHDLFERVDAVVVTTPNKFHEQYAVDALEAGLDVLLEKPLAHSIESAERIADAAHDADGFCMVGFHSRFHDQVEIIKDHQTTGRFGDVTHVEANYVRQRGIPGRGSWFTAESVAGGGALIDIGVHALDLALHFLDFPEVVEVSGTTRSEFGTDDDYAYVEMWGDDEGAEHFDVDDSATALIRCADGQTISLEIAWATNRPPSQEFFVRGTEAGARFDKSSGDLQFYEAGQGGAHHLATTDVETRAHDPHRQEQSAFLETAATSKPLERNTVDQALTVQRVIDAIYRSGKTSRSIRLDEAAETDAQFAQE